MENQIVDIADSFKKRLKQLRINKDWSQKDLALKLKIDTQRVSKMERGLIKPPIDILIELSLLFEVSLDYLITGNSHIENKTINNPELINRIQEIDKLPDKKQVFLIALMDAFIKQQKFEELVNS